MADNAQADVKKLSFERAMEELESIVKRLEDGKVPLEESVAIYEPLDDGFEFLHRALKAQFLDVRLGVISHSRFPGCVNQRSAGTRRYDAEPIKALTWAATDSFRP
jgi:hypothetical protein